MIQGWYYLHQNGDLIYKRELGGTAADIRESDFAKALWPFDSSDRESVWRIIIEGLAAGAKKERVFDLAKKWGCDEADADIYSDRLNVVLEIDGHAWCAHRINFINIVEDACGFGDTKVEALSDFANNLGYQPSKMWGNTFKQLIES